MNKLKEPRRFPMGFEGWLGIIFIVLKLTRYIDFNWFFVLIPIFLYFIQIILLSVYSPGWHKHNRSLDFVESIQLVFITLKLTGHITWSWWVVLLPGLLTLMAIIFLAIGIVWGRNNENKVY